MSLRVVVCVVVVVSVRHVLLVGVRRSLLPFVVCCLLLLVYWLLFVVCCLLFVDCSLCVVGVELLLIGC